MELQSANGRTSTVHTHQAPTANENIHLYQPRDSKDADVNDDNYERSTPEQIEIQRRHLEKSVVWAGIFNKEEVD